ncbi:DUF547 domain-containing protein [Erythrobacter sp. THAF29]|uniref:DUF547 domain-containing protein n=1 Tax=Erythrobacter sp. THAF29 TaxID=2587851 RepID=UPI001268885A|nr:DUF547 domain-containing protein [Erythrobacter sp. THAF29]QFT78747.1 hypothetical protein FIU90_14450 [Erythrobacter sp. THAF29]
MKPRTIVGALALSSLAAPLAANTSAEFVQPVTSGAKTGDGFAQFTPSADRRDHRIDYAHWDEALAWLVIPMGPSIREGAPRATPGTGTRFIYGHTSRYRLEGNRVAFTYVDGEIRRALTEYRRDLERVGTELDLTNLPRNEQLAFWLNLHNVAVIEALAQQYPLRDPSDGSFGSNGTGLQDAKLVTVKGVSLSPRDIREKIVYPNWNDPKVIYGFFRGEIGGPSIQRIAFDGTNVDALLALSAEEFVNSLRGVEAFNGALRVSRIYEEAERFYFPDDRALRQHLTKYAREDVKRLIGKYDRTAFNRYESDIADLVYGRADPGLNFVCAPITFDIPSVSGDVFGAAKCADQATRPNRAEQRLMEERAQKLTKAWKQGIRTGQVIYGDGQYAEGEPPREVE